MFVLKPVKITRKHLTKQVGAGELEGVPERGNSLHKVPGAKGVVRV